MNKVQTLLTVLALLFGISGSGVADFKDGIDAYQKGDYKIAFNEWKPLAEQGHTDAQHNLGWMYDNGRGVLKDYKQAVKWYQKAADQRDADAWKLIYSFRKKADTSLQICFTGFGVSKKKELVHIAENSNMKVVSSVTKKLDFLCGGDNSGPKKIEKAESQGVQFLTESQFINLIETGEAPKELL